MDKAVFGGGCFWCTEAVFKMLKGVKVVKPGYAGGSARDATYEKVSLGNTGHAEVIYIEYDPKEISYDNLLTVFFATHDPTTLNRQGNDVGSQYRSIIFYTNKEQKMSAEKFISEINLSNSEGSPAVTELEPLDNFASGEASFYEAENYHLDYYANNQGAPYCQVVINPKLDKVKKQFSQLLESYEK